MISLLFFLSPKLLVQLWELGGGITYIILQLLAASLSVGRLKVIVCEYKLLLINAIRHVLPFSPPSSVEFKTLHDESEAVH
jgi:hypothetical protein